MMDGINTKLMDIRLGVRTWNTLETMGLVTVGDAMAVTDAQYLSQPNFGKISLMDLRSACAEAVSHRPSSATADIALHDFLQWCLQNRMHLDVLRGKNPASQTEVRTK